MTIGTAILKPHIYMPHSPQARAMFLDPAVLDHLVRFTELVYPRDGQQPWDDVPPTIEAIITGWGGPAMLPRSVWQSLPRLKAIAVLGGSPVIIEDAVEAVEKDIRIISASHAIAEGVAEETVGLMLASQYELVTAACAYRSSGRLIVDGSHRNRSLAGATIGLIGFGYVGQQVAARLRAFHPELWVFDPYIKEEVAQQHGVRAVSLEQLLRESDIISVHAGWTRETEGMLDRARLDLVRPGTLIVSTARMPLFDQHALAEKIRDGYIRFASDFVPFESNLWSAEDLHSCDNLIAVPGHTSITTRTVKQMGLLLAEDLERLFRGERPAYAVSKEWICHTTMLVPARH